MNSFFDEILRLRPQAVLHEVRRRLVAEHPGQFVMHTTSSLFGVVTFLHGKQATSVTRDEYGPVVDYQPNADESDVTISLVHRWDEVTWEGAKFQVVSVTLREDNCTDDNTFIVGPDYAAVKRFFLAVCAWCSTVRGEVLVYEDGLFRRNEELHRDVSRARFDDLILPAALLEQVRDDVRRFVTAKDTYERYRVPWKRGLLLLGPPGNGKTHTLRALIAETKWPCLYVKSFRNRNGSTEGGVHAVFERARRAAPCVLVLEDLDCLVTEETRSVLLNELDGFAQNQGLLVIASTNHPEKIDRSLLDRPSRFDRKFHFALPGPEERRRYLQRWQGEVEAELRLSPAGLELLVDGTHGFTFAYLKELTFSAMLAFMERPLAGEMDTVAAEVLTGLKGEMSSARKLLPPVPGTERKISLSA